MTEWKDAGDFNTWDYKELGKGAKLQGIFVKQKSGVGENNSNLYTLRVNGELVDVWGSSILDTRFSNLEVGEEVLIEYLGEEKSEKRKGKTYHNFKVMHRKPEMEEVAEDLDSGLDDIDMTDIEV